MTENYHLPQENLLESVKRFRPILDRNIDKKLKGKKKVYLTLC